MYALGEDEEVFSKLEHEAPCMDEEIESLFFCLNDVLQNENLTEENIDTIKIELNKIEGKINTAMEKFQNYISSSIAE